MLKLITGRPLSGNETVVKLESVIARRSRFCRELGWGLVVVVRMTVGCGRVRIVARRAMCSGDGVTAVGGRGSG